MKRLMNYPSPVQPELLVNTHDQCGENPLWDDRRQLLFWVDIAAGLIRAYDPAEGTYRLVKDLERECGAFTLQADGSLLLLLTDEMGLLNPETGEYRELRRGFAANTGRFNDCIADPKGRIFAGTVDFEKKCDGGIHRIGTDGGARELWRGTGCSNGWGFTPDRTGLYFSDTTAAHVLRYPYDEDTGELGAPDVFLSVPGLMPDGMTVDGEGSLWIAFWDLHVIRRYSPGGELLEEISLPSHHVTSCVFGGKNLDDLYITTATGGSSNAEPGSGGLYRIRPDIGGSPEYRSNIS